MAKKSVGDLMEAELTAEPLVIDGSTLEGGGQVIRTALSLAWVPKERPLRIHSIRAARPKPGLANQHLMGARLAARLNGRTLSGDHKGSVSLEAAPQSQCTLPLTLEATSDTGGATTLLLQASLPPLLFCAAERELVLRGGTEGSYAPPAAHTELVLAPLLRAMGADIELRVVRRNFVDGNPELGELRVRARLPCGTLRPLELMSRGVPRAVRGVVALAAGGSADAAGAVLALLQPALEQLECLQGATVSLERALVDEGGGGGGRGGGGRADRRGGRKGRTVLCSTQLAVTTEGGCILSANATVALTPDGGGAHKVVMALSAQLQALLGSGACACEHTTDQLIAYMALAAGTSRLKALPVGSLTSQHLPTVLHFSALLTGATFRVRDDDDGCQLIECDGIGAQAAPPPRAKEAAPVQEAP
eukprot:CAMPEP_0119074790 /NCGR_PEP_ID=MMETSP1178-20130426/73391_1 /TAXON_ID=33656 /ORGANISM="unid sp, Strain CCMP2000" /LENGTH=419 /DNA_ID=CAMNT_0007056961 /DNA_START=63 /DNA_END=1322 /DNA_ORIENTATION=-